MNSHVLDTKDEGLRVARPIQARRALPEDGFVRQTLILEIVPFSKSTLWRRIGAGLFPAPIKLSAGITVWRAEDVRRWIAERG